MTGLVVDASIALAWYFEDEVSPLAMAAFEASNSMRIVVPPHWYFEISNGILVGERKGRMNPSDVGPFVSRLSDLIIEIDDTAVGAAMTQILPLARDCQLTVYDALYLELAVRHTLPLATLDRDLELAARKAGVTLFTGDEL